MSLTEFAVKGAKPRLKPYKLADGGGLYLLVKADGGRYWRLDYRLHGKRKTLAIGVYPAVSLADARTAREDARSLLRDGIDPSTQKRIAAITARNAAANTFSAVAEEYKAKCITEGLSAATLTKLTWLLEDHLYPLLRTRPISEIEPPELLEVLRRAEERGLLETATRLRSLCGRIFRYAIATGRAKRDPAADLRGALATAKPIHRAAILDPKAVGELMRAVESYTGQETTKIALRIAPLLFVRPGELRHAEWPEFDFDAALWRLPASKMKMRTAHLVPLSTQAIALLKELRKLTGRGKYLFPSTRSVLRPMSDNTVNAAFRRLGYAKDEITAHGLRRMASTLLNENGFNGDWIERQLAHAEQDEVRAAYNAAEYLPERRKMMQWWADYLERLAHPAEALQNAPKPRSVRPSYNGEASTKHSRSHANLVTH
jgi:integrase